MTRLQQQNTTKQTTQTHRPVVLPVELKDVVRLPALDQLLLSDREAPDGDGRNISAGEIVKRTKINKKHSKVMPFVAHAHRNIEVSAGELSSANVRALFDAVVCSSHLDSWFSACRAESTWHSMR